LFVSVKNHITEYVIFAVTYNAFKNIAVFNILEIELKRKKNGEERAEKQMWHACLRGREI
jgi:hypothetical protein